MNYAMLMWQPILHLKRFGFLHTLSHPVIGLAGIGMSIMLLYPSSKLGLAWVAAGCLLVGWGLYRRYRLLSDSPMAALHSSAQGYVKLQGTAYLPHSQGFRGAPDMPTTVWLSGHIEDEPFMLQDGAGCCMLYPEYAEVLTRKGNNHLWYINAIYPGQTIYTLGQLRSHGADNLPLDTRQRHSEILSDWKSRPAMLLDAFDSNGNGKIDEDEWQNARDHALNLANQDIQDKKRAPFTHTLEGSNNHWFLISTIPLETLAQRYWYATMYYHLAWIGISALVLT